MIICVYKNNVLIDLVLYNKIFLPSENYDAIYKLTKDQSSEDYKIKVYIWNDVTKINPLGLVINSPTI